MPVRLILLIAFTSAAAAAGAIAAVLRPPVAVPLVGPLLTGHYVASAFRASTADMPQVSGVRVRHRAGQTLVTWEEAIPLVDTPAPSIGHIKQLRADADRRQKIRYHIYRSGQPITSVAGLAAIGSVSPLTGWNTDLYGIYAAPEPPAIRYVVDEGQEPIGPRTGVFAFNPVAPGDGYYAVTVSIDGRENRIVAAANVSAEPAKETVGPGEPILQRVVKRPLFQYVENPTLDYYVRWEGPPNSNVAGRPFDYLVAVPQNRKKLASVGLHLHCWGGSLEGGYGWWYNGHQGAVLISSNQIPYDWWTGYPDRYQSEPLVTAADWQQATVHPYSQRRMLSFLDWAAAKYSLDTTRTFTAGDSMGGSGALMLAIRRPERIAWAVSWVGVHVPLESPLFKDSYKNVFGDPAWGVKFEDGTPVWDYFDDVKYLRAHVGQDTPLLIFSNGKNDGGIGWKQAVQYLHALQDTRRPHIFHWGQGGHGERAGLPPGGDERTMVLNLSVDRSLPAFTHGSLDDDPGSGDELDGSPSGNVNRYLTWDVETVRDEAATWEMTVILSADAPKDQSTVDITPRRVQKFKTPPGTTVAWTNVPKGGGATQRGTVTADQWGLITLPQVLVGKHHNRITLTRDVPATTR
jgi:pimeloyl-ACP methyl ester carboxylesterase